MTPSDQGIRCARCQQLFTVPPEWRIALCPNCGHPNTRMDTDETYD